MTCGALRTGATNRPQDLDEAVLRRLVKRIYVPLPDYESRLSLVRHLLQSQKHNIRDLSGLIEATEGFSASDLTALCREAAMGPIRDLGQDIINVPTSKV